MSKNKRLKSKELDELVKKFVAKKGEGFLFTNYSKGEKVLEDKSSAEEVSYLDLCARYNMKHDEYEANAKQIDTFLNVGWIGRKKMPKKAAEKIIKAGMPEVATYKYLLQKKESSSSSRTKETSCSTRNSDRQVHRRRWQVRGVVGRR